MRKTFTTVCIFCTFSMIGCYENRDPATRDKPSSTVNVEDVKSDAVKAVNSASEYASESKEKLIQKWREQLSTMDSQMQELRVKGEQLTADAKDDWSKKMTDLEEKRQAARDKVTELENSTAEAWKDIEKGASAAWSDLKKAFQDASRDF